MNTETMTEQLKAHPFLKDLPEKYITLIAGCAESVQFNEGDFLMRKNQPADCFYLLIKGLVSIRSNLAAQGTTTIETVVAPDAIGWAWLSPPYKSHFDVVAVKNTRAILVHTPCLVSKIETDHSFGFEMYKRFMEVVIDRLQGSRMQMMDIYAKPGQE